MGTPIKFQYEYFPSSSPPANGSELSFFFLWYVSIRKLLSASTPKRGHAQVYTHAQVQSDLKAPRGMWND